MTPSLAHVGFSASNALHQLLLPITNLFSVSGEFLFTIVLKTQISASVSIRPFWASHLELISPSSDPCMFFIHVLEPFLLSALYFNDLSTFILTQQRFTENSLYVRY